MQKEIKDRDSVIKELSKLGAHFGFSRSKRHPSTSAYIFGFKNKTAMVDLGKSLDSLDKAKEFVAKIASEGKQVLFVGNKREAKEAISTLAKEVEAPYVVERWIGGTFTNFKQIRIRVEKMKDYRDKEQKGELMVYTKKERGVIAKEVEKLEKFFASIANMEKIPGAIFVVDVNAEKIAVDEAHLLKVPVITLSSPDCDIRGIEYPIIANDASRATIEYVVKNLTEAYKEGKKTPLPTPPAAPKE